MHLLNHNECLQISGGNEVTAIATIGAGLAGGIALSTLVSNFPSLTTAVGTMVFATGGAFVCIPVVFPVGSVLCGTASGIFGYFASSTLASLGAFFSGGAVAAGLTYYTLNN